MTNYEREPAPGGNRDTSEMKVKANFGASAVLKHSEALMEDGKAKEQRQIGQRLVQYAGMLAAKEARFRGVVINGWTKD